MLVVADRIAADAKRSLREAGVNYLDRRGELRIVAPPLIGERWPVANHIVVALDIAQERARGLEAIEPWKPDRIVRAW